MEVPVGVFDEGDTMIGKLLERYLRIKSGLLSRWRNYYYRALGCRIDGYVWIQSIWIPRQWADIHIEAGAALDEGVVLLASDQPVAGKIHIGQNVYINRRTMLDASLSISIGNDTMIGPDCYITDHDHAYVPGTPPGKGGLVNAPTRIGSRVWLGVGVKVLKGVTIGDDCIIGAGSIVTRDIPAKSLAVGAPAKVIRQLGFN